MKHICHNYRIITFLKRYKNIIKEDIFQKIEKIIYSCDRSKENKIPLATLEITYNNKYQLEKFFLMYYKKKKLCFKIFKN